PRSDHGAQPQGGPDRQGKQPAARPGCGARPQRRLPHRPPDEQGLIPRSRPSEAERMETTMLTIPIFNPSGEKVGEETIDPADFGGEVNKQLLHDVVLMHLAARRVGTVNTRGRADVAGSGKKLFRQKGTGNARAGSKRTNKRKGGGVAFARRNRDYSYALPKKAVRSAIRMALLSKFQDGQALVLDGLNLSAPKTKVVAQALKAIRRPDLTEA